MRKYLLHILVYVFTFLLLTRLFYLQIIDDSFKVKSDNNAIKIKYDYPERGYIFDRNGELLVSNQRSYDVMVVPREVKNLDTMAFCNLMKITKADFLKKMKKATTWSPRLPSVFISQLTKREYAAIQEKMNRLNGFYIQKRSLRDYNVDVAANVFGYITQVNEALIDRNPYYKSGDLIGMQGVEQTYENILRGEKGVKYVQRDRYNREIGPYKDGLYDTIAVQGKNLHLTLDIELQKYGEALMKNKRGGIVAIEPSTGEILALVTAPSYDPALLVGRDKSKNYTQLYRDSISKPLYDRGLLAEYVPGSTFKIMTALVALQEGVIDEHTHFYCRNGFSYGRGAFMGCHDVGSNNLLQGITKSCNAYFGNTYLKTMAKYVKPADAMNIWSNHIKSTGMGKFLGYDLPAGRKGHIPDAKFYQRYYPNGGWRGTTTVSNAIGQGEVLATPIQLANMMAVVANKGYYYTPHIVKKIEGGTIDKKFLTKHVSTIDPKHYEPVIRGLHEVFRSGTASRLQVDSLNICGKTGTAENFAKINGVKTQLTDHSIFVAFAPMENPKIAIAVFVENGYYGARIAGPIASLMIEKYVKGEVKRLDMEKRMLEYSLQNEYAKYISGQPFTINK